jgi:hypothetical protein
VTRPVPRVADPDRPVTGDPVPIRWTELRYELRTDDGRVRAQLWRRLRRHRGLNLRHGRWAVPDTPTGPADLGLVVEFLQAAGATVHLGAAGATPLATSTHADTDPHALLVAACERAWSPFFTAVDRLTTEAAAPPHAGRPAPAFTLACGLAALHDTYHGALVRDLVHAGAATRAARRLDDLEWMVRNVQPAALPALAPLADPTIEVASTVVLADGRLRAVGLLTPTPAPAWEHAFEVFERNVYRPDGSRAVIRHGAVVAVGSADGITCDVIRASARVQRFNSSLV